MKKDNNTTHTDVMSVVMACAAKENAQNTATNSPAAEATATQKETDIARIKKVLDDMIKVIEDHDKYMHDLEALLGSCLIESKNNMIFDDAICTIISSICLRCKNTAAVKDTIEWYIYEYLNFDEVIKDGPSIKTAAMFDKDDNPLCYDTYSLAEYIYEDEHDDSKQ